MDLIIFAFLVVICAFIISQLVNHTWHGHIRWLIISPVILVLLFAIIKVMSFIGAALSTFYQVSPIYGWALGVTTLIFVFIAYKSLEHIKISRSSRKKR